LALLAENTPHNEFVEFVALEGRVDECCRFRFEGGEVGLTEGPFAHQEESAVFRGELVIDGRRAGERGGFRGLWDDV